MTPAMRLAVLVVASVISCGNCGNHSFVPMCIAEQCSREAIALGNDAYAKELARCTVDDFGPCAKDAWDCLGDDACRQVLTCAPKVFETCKEDIWKMLTDPSEREKLMCLTSCMKDGKVEPLCVTAKCGKAAAQCLFDSTCRDAAMCVPKAQLACSKPAFECVFGKDDACRKNLQCLGHGVTHCGSPAVNMMTDSHIADFVSCAGSKCPHPISGDAPAKMVAAAAQARGNQPANSAEQLLCMAEKCSPKAFKLLGDQDTKNLIECALQSDLPSLCTSVWDCLGDKTCSNDLTCMTAPFNSCKEDIWHVLTNADERQRIEQTVSCLSQCQNSHQGDFVDASFCVLDSCSEKILSCYRDDTCRKAVKCVPSTLGQCAVPLLDAYAHEKLFQSSVKCLGRGLESCGRAAVEMLRNQDVAEAVQCASQCTRTPQNASMTVVV